MNSKKQKIFTVIGGVFILLILISFFYSDYTLKNSSSTPISTTIAPGGDFSIVETYPGIGEVEFTTPNTAFGIQFSKEINLESVNITIFPSTDFKTIYDQQNKILYVQSTIWEYDTTYRITISVRSVNGERISEVFEIKPLRPKPPSGDVF